MGAWQTWSMKRDVPSYRGYRFPPRDHQPRRLAVSPCAAASCREDDGRPVEVGGQEPASNHPKRLSLRVAVVSVGETSSMTRQVWIRKTNVSEPPLTRREPVHVTSKPMEGDTVGRSLGVP